jgi:hypothetical protein
VESRATVIIPLDERLLFVSSLNCADFSSWLSEVAQTLDAISGDSALGRWRRARRAVVSWHGLSQGPPQRVIAVAGALYAVWVSAFWRQWIISVSAPRMTEVSGKADRFLRNAYPTPANTPTNQTVSFVLIRKQRNLVIAFPESRRM